MLASNLSSAYQMPTASFDTRSFGPAFVSHSKLPPLKPPPSPPTTLPPSPPGVYLENTRAWYKRKDGMIVIEENARYVAERMSHTIIYEFNTTSSDNAITIANNLKDQFDYVKHGKKLGDNNNGFFNRELFIVVTMLTIFLILSSCCYCIYHCCRKWCIKKGSGDVQQEYGGNEDNEEDFFDDDEEDSFDEEEDPSSFLEHPLDQSTEMENN
ncbi:unnamed protein product [Caenorhabditis nigoni]